jgi:hypothetical protein
MKNQISWSGLILGVIGLSFAANTFAALKTEKIFIAEAKKSKTYIRGGVIVGGDWAIDDFAVTGIRRAANSGFERIVVDLDGNRAGEPAALDRPPYYHVSIMPELKRLVVTVVGKPKIALDPAKITAVFKKSQTVSKVELLPMVEKDRWSFVLHLKQATGVEVFELTKPTRIILDLQASAEHAAAHTAVRRQTQTRHSEAPETTEEN